MLGLPPTVGDLSGYPMANALEESMTTFDPSATDPNAEAKIHDIAHQAQGDRLVDGIPTFN